MKNFLRTAASILLTCAALFAQADWTTLQKEVQSAKNRDEAVGHIKKSEHAKEAGLAELLDDYNSATTKAVKDTTFNTMKQLVSANALSENFKNVKSAEATAKEIKKDPIYTAEKEAISSNWIQKLFDRLRNIFNNNNKKNDQPTRDLPSPPMWIGTLLQGLFYLLCAAIIGALVYLVIKIPWAWTAAGRAKKAKRRGMLEDGEQLLSEDEYLLEADRLIAGGRYREACRALFLASLLRIDSSRIARFEPTQTNWEHLLRIESSKSKPESLDFRSTTKAFDLAWYGYRAKRIDDVAIFRETYITIKTLTEVPK